MPASTPTLARPAPDEFAPYYGRYVVRVPEEADPLVLLDSQRETVRALLGGLADSEAGFRYAEGKWSVREVVGHLADAERAFAYRALRFARRDPTPLPGFDEGPWAAASNADDRPLPELLDEFDSVRAATTTLFRSFPAEAFSRVGQASGHDVSVRALLFILLGHVEHHLAILRDRYFARMDAEA